MIILKKKKMVKCKYCANFKKIPDWCYQVEDSPDTERERECEHYVQRLNIDEIREMKCEDMAEFLLLVRLSGLNMSKGEKDKILLWLNSPMEED